MKILLKTENLIEEEQIYDASINAFYICNEYGDFYYDGGYGHGDGDDTYGFAYEQGDGLGDGDGYGIGYGLGFGAGNVKKFIINEDFT